MSATKQLRELFPMGQEESPVFREITDDEYRQLECGIYNQWGRRLNITPRVLDEDGIWTGEYKDWSHLQVINVRQSHFEYLNALWLFKDQRPNRIFKHYCKETYIFDKKCIVIQQLNHDFVSAKILTNDEELKLYIEDVLAFKPMSVVPKREIREINELEHHGMKFGSNQINTNVQILEEEVDKDGLVITNIDHFDNYVYEIYDSLRNIYKHINNRQAERLAEAQVVWLEEWIEKPLTNEIDSIIPYMTDEVIKTLDKYTYRNRNFWDRQACGSFLYKETKMKVFDIDEMEYVIVKGKRMEKICKELDIPITIGWDIWKILNKDKMEEIIQELYEEYPL